MSMGRSGKHQITGRGELTPLPDFTVETDIVMCFLDTVLSSILKQAAWMLNSWQNHRIMILTAGFASFWWSPSQNVLFAWTKPYSLVYNRTSKRVVLN